jgi:hypothetical protein
VIRDTSDKVAPLRVVQHTLCAGDHAPLRGCPHKSLSSHEWWPMLFFWMLISEGFSVPRAIAARGQTVERHRMGSGERFGAGEGAFAPPLVIFAQLGLVFFDLRFEVAEGLLATGPNRGADARGMQSAIGEG